MLLDHVELIPAVVTKRTARLRIHHEGINAWLGTFDNKIVPWLRSVMRDAISRISVNYQAVSNRRLPFRVQIRRREVTTAWFPQARLHIDPSVVQKDNALRREQLLHGPVAPKV